MWLIVVFYLLVLSLLVANLIVVSLSYHDQSKNDSAVISGLTHVQSDVAVQSESVNNAFTKINQGISNIGDLHTSSSETIRRAMTKECTVTNESVKSLKEYFQNPYHLQHLGILTKQQLSAMKDKFEREQDDTPIDYHPFAESCLKMAQDDTHFSTFRQDPAVVDMLEHVKRYEAEQYEQIAIMMSKNYSVNIPWEEIVRNDSVGSPLTYPLKSRPNMNICPTTCRYLVLGMKALQHASTFEKELNIIEVGGGYGGQCCVILRLASIFGMYVKSYTILDLREANLLQNKFIQCQLSENDKSRVRCMCISDEGVRRLLQPGSFFFSAYAYSEISESIQMSYNVFLSDLIHHGFLVWNNKKPPTDGFFRMINKQRNEVDVLEERPLTGPFNVIYQF